MSINRGLCKQKWEWFQEVSNREIQEILWLFSRIAICRTQHFGCILRTNTTKLSKENDIVPLRYLFSACLWC